MKLLKIIGFMFLIHFIRRFIQAYQAMKRVQDENERLKASQAQPRPTSSHQQSSNPDIVNADFRVID